MSNTFGWRPLLPPDGIEASSPRGRLDSVNPTLTARIVAWLAERMRRRALWEIDQLDDELVARTGLERRDWKRVLR